MADAPIWPYWSFGPVPVLDALEEGRRHAALELATRTRNVHDDTVLQRAARYEAFLKGEVTEITTVYTEEYEELIKRSNHLLALEAAGVDNWEGYVGAE